MVSVRFRSVRSCILVMSYSGKLTKARESPLRETTKVIRLWIGTLALHRTGERTNVDFNVLWIWKLDTFVVNNMLMIHGKEKLKIVDTYQTSLMKKQI